MKIMLILLFILPAMLVKAFCISSTENDIRQADIIFAGRADTSFYMALWKKESPLCITNFVIYAVYRGDITYDYVSIISGLEYKYYSSFSKDSVYLVMAGDIEETNGLYKLNGCSTPILLSHAKNFMSQFLEPVYRSVDADNKMDEMIKQQAGKMHIPPHLYELRMEDIKEDLLAEKEKNQRLKNSATLGGFLFLLSISALVIAGIKN